MSDRLGNRWWIIDVDATKQAARQRALPHERGLPAPHRRLGQVCAPGYTGRKRGEVVRTRTTVLQPFTHQWIGTYSGAGNGKYREELKRALQAITWYALAFSLPLSQVVIRLDGLYGNAASFTDVLRTGLGVIVRSKDYALLKREEVRACLARPAACQCTHPESGTFRTLYDCPDIPLSATGPRVRVIVATHPAGSHKPAIGVVREGVVYEVFVTALPQSAFSAKDVLDLYLHRGSFETVLADEDSEQDPDRWVSHTPNGQECFQILNQWLWNIRLELGQQLSPTPMRTTAFAPALKSSPAAASDPAPVSDPAPASDPAPTSEPALMEYGPPQWARPSFTGGFPGSAFRPQPDGTLLCPAHHPLYPQERRPERDGSYRVLYAARIGDCRNCALRAQCQESPSTSKPRRVSAVFWPLTSLTSPQTLPSAPIFGPLEPFPLPSPTLGRFPLLWHDWPRCSIRRRWMQVLRSETVGMAREPTPEQTEALDEPLLTRAQRAHWRFSWQQRLVRNARPESAPSLTLTLHGLPASFAHAYGFSLTPAA
jgi:hypothetical protein